MTYLSKQRFIRRLRISGLMLLGVALASAAFAEKAARQKVVLCLGDSLTEGYGLAEDQAFPAVLEARLHAQGRKDVRVVNAGISGSTSASAVSRLRWQMRAKPDILILELGANDGLRGVSIEDTRKNLAAAITMAKQQRVVVLLAGMQMPPNYGPEYTRDFGRVFHELAEELEVALIPFFLEGVAGQPKLNLPDGIHPTAEGYRIVVENLLPHLLPLL
jgi:acyl-CoA thioesterase-1